MPATYGAPAKVNVMEEDNKVRIKLLSYDDRGNLTDTVSNTLKNNILSYLSEYKMINDYLDIDTGEVIDFSLEIDLNINKNSSQTDILQDIIETVTSFFSIDKRKMGDPLFVGNLNREIGSVSGVENVIETRVFNKIGGEYSSSEVSQAYSDTVTKEISQSDNTIFMKSNQIYQIRFPNKDIKVRVKTLGSTTF
jgi:septum formation topological specificity factor MinE